MQLTEIIVMMKATLGKKNQVQSTKLQSEWLAILNASCGEVTS